MSSGPSEECSHCLPSGATLSIHESRSVRTSGQQFSLIVIDALVCWMKRLRSPDLNWRSSGRLSRISSVTRWHPRGIGGREMAFWTTAKLI